MVPPSIVLILTFAGQTFSNSEMGRDLIKVSATVDGASQDCLFMTAHLESLGDKRNSGKRYGRFRGGPLLLLAHPDRRRAKCLEKTDLLA